MYFNSHAHVERDPEIARAFCSLKNFNSHAHVERDFVRRQYDVWKNNFNSHAHVERDVKGVYDIHSPSISTHTLTWSVTNLIMKNARIRIISTHTLTWSVTRRINNTIKLINISTHTLTWSVTVAKSSSNEITLHFNSHAHVERDFQRYGYSLDR